jgi:hypothetical protein
MRTIIAGGRTFNDFQLLCKICNSVPWTITTVVSGGANGADKLGEQYAVLNSLDIKLYLADWKLHGNSAGFKRNKLMSENADALVAFWDGTSRGTKHMIEIAEKKKLNVFVCNYND